MSENVVALWDSEVKEDSENEPFHHDFLNLSYSYMADFFPEEVNFYVSHYENYRAGHLEVAFRFDGEEWVREENIPVDLVFDKYRFDEETMETKEEIGEGHEVMNPLEIEKICKNKLLTYRRFPDYVPETLEASRENVERMLEQDGKAVLKPPFNYGGEGVNVIDKIEEFEPRENLLVQRFVDSTQGHDALDIKGAHDIRVIVIGDRPETAFLRTPDSGYVSNVSRGGDIEVLGIEKVPKEGISVVEEVIEEFKDMNPTLYSVDLIFDSDQKPWILELNSKPAISFREGESREDINREKKILMRKTAELLSDYIRNH